MNREATPQDNGEIKNNYGQQQEGVSYAYEGSYAMYSSNTSVSSTVNQPLPGQPPLPPMPPPPGALPPLPHVYSPVASQVASIQTWPAPPPHWQWITPQASALQSQSQRDMANNVYQREAIVRSNYTRRDRFNQNRTSLYPPRNNFHPRNKNRRPQQRFEPASSQAQFDSSAYFGQTLGGSIGLDWQRSNIAATGQNEAMINHMTASIPGHQIANVASRISAARSEDDIADQGVKIISEVALKKTKQRKPMSQNYPSRPWNREDAESALQIENEYNKTIRAQSLIIKFPDPDLNKDIVREFHPGIQNIHFQSPSGPRYCFIQMAENVNIDKAISDLEKVRFGVGNLKVERKSLRDEDNPMPEEIDPYTLYVGNLPESVNVNEVKSKFPTAARVDVGYAQKMRNTRYAFIRYTNVEESIAAYKQAHDLMWDTRSIIVRFRRQRGNTCLPGEPKNNSKKVKEEPAGERVKNERANSENPKDAKISSSQSQSRNAAQKNHDKHAEERSVDSSTSSQSATTNNDPTPPCQSNWRSSKGEADTRSTSVPDKEAISDTILITEIKEEPEDYEDMEMPYMEEDDDDDDDDVDDDDDEDEMVREEDADDIENDNVEEEDDEEEDMMAENNLDRIRGKVSKDSEPPDDLDEMFGQIENSIPRDLEL